MPLSPFDFIKTINGSKEDLIRDNPHVEQDYIPFVVNKAFSLHTDTIMFANFMNMNPHLARKQQYDFYRLAVKKRKRFEVWPKNQKNEDAYLLATHFNISLNKAKEIIRTLPQDKINELKKIITDGLEEGVKK